MDPTTSGSHGQSKAPTIVPRVRENEFVQFRAFLLYRRLCLCLEHS